MMSPHEDEVSELLWRYIEECKRADDPQAVHFVARTEADPNEIALLLPVADAAHAALQDDGWAASGQAEARQRLVAAIRADRANSAKPGKERPIRKSPSFSARGRRHAALILLVLLVAMAAALGYSAWLSGKQAACEQPVNIKKPAAKAARASLVSPPSAAARPTKWIPPAGLVSAPDCLSPHSRISAAQTPHKTSSVP